MDKLKKEVFTTIAGLCLFVAGVYYAINFQNTAPIKPVTVEIAKAGTIIDVATFETAFPGSMYTKKDVTCLARNIYFEARNEPILGQHAVAWVTVNRMKHKKWPSTVCEVVHQSKQFSWTIKLRYNKTYDKKAYRRAVLIAKDTLHEYYIGGEDLSAGALFYHADYVKPKWRKRLTKLAQIQTHIFYKHKEK